MFVILKPLRPCVEVEESPHGVEILRSAQDDLKLEVILNPRGFAEG